MQDKQRAVSSNETWIIQWAKRDTPSDQLLQRIYENLSVEEDEHGNVTRFWLDSEVFDELELFLYPDNDMV